MSERSFIPCADPSANTLRLIDDTIKYFEKMLKQNQEFNDSKLELVVEATRRESEAETRRIDGRQAADAEMVKVANQAAIQQAQALASQVAENAETLRAGMSKTAETLATQLQVVTSSLDNRLKIVETNQYTLAGSSKGKGDMWGWVASGVILIIAVVGFLSKW